MARAGVRSRPSLTGVSTYCACPPSRCGAATIRRAMRFAICAPKSRRTKCKQASMPAALPAEVIMLSVSTYITSSATITRGYILFSASLKSQWVVAGRLSKSPAAPKTNAPEQIESKVAPRAAARRSWRNSGSGGRSSMSRQPGIMMVLQRARSANTPVVCTRTPAMPRFGPASAGIIKHSYHGTPRLGLESANTSAAIAYSNVLS